MPRKPQIGGAQERLLDFLFAYLDEHGTSPSPEDIATGSRMHAGNVGGALRVLKMKGLVAYEEAPGRRWLVNFVIHPVHGKVEIEDSIYVPELDACRFISDLDESFPIVERRCLCCKAAFETRSRFIRLCPPCREVANATIDGADFFQAGEAYSSNASMVAIGAPGFGIGGFRSRGVA